MTTAVDRRIVLAAAVAMAMPGAAAARRRWDAIVSTTNRPGTVPTIAAALAIARTARRPCAVLVERGIYREKLALDVPDLHLVGEGAASIVTFGAAAGLVDPNGRRWGTGGSATLTVTAPGVTIERLTIRNDFDYLADQVTGASGGAQAVALSLAAGADRTTVRDCAIEGYQDTLYVRDGRALFRDCLVSGCVDFVFGGAAALFDACEIRSRAVPGALAGYIAAPSTPSLQPVGLVFRDCRATREPGVPDGGVYLGRPWRAGGNMALLGAAAFVDCWLDRHIQAEGWTWMAYRDPAGASRQLTPREARLVEIDSRGPGRGIATPDRRLLAQSDRPRFAPAAMFGDWRPAR